jgi:hypothetical protein
MYYELWPCPPFFFFGFCRESIRAWFLFLIYLPVSVISDGLTNRVKIRPENVNACGVKYTFIVTTQVLSKRMQSVIVLDHDCINMSVCCSQHCQTFFLRFFDYLLICHIIHTCEWQHVVNARPLFIQCCIRLVKCMTIWGEVCPNSSAISKRMIATLPTC